MFSIVNKLPPLVSLPYLNSYLFWASQSLGLSRKSESLSLGLISPVSLISRTSPAALSLNISLTALYLTSPHCLFLVVSRDSVPSFCRSELRPPPVELCFELPPNTLSFPGHGSIGICRFYPWWFDSSRTEG